MDTRDYWAKKHNKYATQEWINNANLFAQFVIKYFPKGGKLLDLGAGQGQDSRFFAQKGFYITSVDFSEEALAISRKKANMSGLNIKVINVDITKKLPFENQSFDIVYSHLALHYWNTTVTQSIFSEICRVLKVGGILAILLNTTNDPEIKNSKALGDSLWETPSGLVKRFFSTKSLKEFVSKDFETLLLDAEGETFKDEVKTLIRFIGKRR